MSLSYKVFSLQCPEAYREIFIAELAELGFDMMEETETGIKAFSESDDINTSMTEELLNRYEEIGVTGIWSEVENTNWNEEWEKNYDPVVVEQKCLIRADFHDISGSYPYELIINPRMSFGTGHHATTYLMVQAAMEIDFNQKKVLDAGCGTGVLAILAEKLGAEDIDAYDVSQLCVDNTADNIQANHCQHIQLKTGTIAELDLKDSYDIIFANINKNILLEEIPHFVERMDNGGVLLLSGFFEKDAIDLEIVVQKCGLQNFRILTRDGWACLVVGKNQMN